MSHTLHHMRDVVQSGSGWCCQGPRERRKEASLAQRQQAPPAQRQQAPPTQRQQAPLAQRQQASLAWRREAPPAGFRPLLIQHQDFG